MALVSAWALWLSLFLISFPSWAKVLSYPLGMNRGSYPKPLSPVGLVMIDPSTLPSKCASFSPFLAMTIMHLNLAVLGVLAGSLESSAMSLLLLAWLSPSTPA